MEKIFFQYTVTYPLSENYYATNKANLVNFHIKHPLITAIRKGYRDVAILMIQLGAQSAEEYKIEYENVIAPKQYEIDRKNAMCAAIEQNHYDIVLSLLLAGFDPNASTPLNPTPKERSGSPKYQDRSVYTTPLLRAVELKQLHIAKLLLDNGADVDKKSSSSHLFLNKGYQYPFIGTPLLKAVDDNFFDAVLLLLGYGANPLENTSTICPLERAVQKGYSDIVDVLFDSTIK